MASHTYSLTDAGDGAVTTYFGTASMSAINASQSAEFSVNYVEDNMLVNTVYLEHSDSYTAVDSDGNPAGPANEGTYTPSISSDNGSIAYTFPANIDSLELGTPDIFEWEYYSITREWSYIDALSTYFYISGSSTIDPEDTELNLWGLQEQYQISLDSHNEIPSDAITIVYYIHDVAPESFAVYQNLGITDPTVTSNEAYSYASGELAGIRTKFGSPVGSTSLSLMQAMISSSVDKIYNTSNISRFNFKKTRAEVLKPREVSSIELLEDFNRPYRGITNG